MNPYKKIQAFTLSEMLVVMLLTTIVVGLSFSVLRLVQKQMLSVQANYNKNLELNTLETGLWIDFNRYSNITYYPIEEELKLKHELDSVTYKFTKNYIVKDRDTFAIPLDSKTFYFNGQTTTNKRIDAIKLTTDKSLQNQQLFIFKHNDANTYMNSWDSN